MNSLGQISAGGSSWHTPTAAAAQAARAWAGRKAENTGFRDYWKGEKKKKNKEKRKGKNILLNLLFWGGNTDSKLCFWLLIKILAWHWEKAVLLRSIPPRLAPPVTH